MRILPTTESLLVPFPRLPRQRPEARRRFFCFPFAGAGASIFREWPPELPDDIQVVGIQLPGRESRIGESPLRHLVTAAKSIAEVLSQHGDLPFAFFGHSVGALLCFEVARELRNLHGSSPSHLFVSGCAGPGRPPRGMPIHQLPDDLFIQKLHGLHGTPQEILENKEVMQIMLPTIRADFELSETYSYERREPLDCPITALGGLQDPEARSGDLPAWQNETRTSFNIRMFPGDHYFIRSCRVPVLRMIAGQLGFAAAGRAAGAPV